MKSTICVEKEVLSTHNNMVRSENGKSKHGKMSIFFVRGNGKL